MYGLARALVAWGLTTALACVFVHRAFVLHVDADHPLGVVASVWVSGQLVGRAVLAHGADHDATLDRAIEAHPGATLVHESVVAEGPVLMRPSIALALSLVPGRDGLAVTWAGRTEYLTPDDLLAHQAYDRGVALPTLGLTIGVDVPLALALLSERFAVPARDLLEGARFRRVRVVRTLPAPSLASAITAASMTEDDVRRGAMAAGRYLARGVDDQGRFRYLVDAPTNQTLPGYDWPRHAGATYYLAQVAALTGDGQVGWATLRAASQMRDHAMVACGDHRCIGTDPVVDVGSTALALLAFIEIARTRLDPAYALLVPELTAFLRGQQRPDGELMHQYDRASSRPIDIQLLYYTGEAALALSRANALLGDPRDLDAARRALARLVGPNWSFVGSRYYFGEEHWTCLAMSDLWDRAPSPSALDFCLRWQAFGRKLQLRDGDTPFDADGAYGLGPLLTPRLTPVGSRAEAGIATLEVARRAGVLASECSRLEVQLRHALALLLRHQLLPGPTYLFADAQAVEGAMPGSAVDWQLRIDYAQHTGSALIRWLGPSQAPPPK